MPYSVHLNKASGLPCNEIYNLHQDQRGFIWIATDMGLYRFDSYEFKSYYASNMSSRSGSYIHEDLKGRIWYCTFDAKLYYVENDTLKAFESEMTLSQSLEYAIIGNKLFAIGRNNNLLIADITTGKLLKEISNSNLISLFCQFGELISVGDGYEIRFLNAEGQSIYTFTAEPDNIIYKVIPYNGKFYSLELTGTAYEIYEIQKHVKKKIYSERLFGSINGFFLIGAQLYLLKKEGVTQVDVNTYAFSKHLLEGNSASHIIKDANGFLWIGTSFDGIYAFPSAASFYSYRLPFIKSRIRVIDQQFIIFNTTGEVYAFDPAKAVFKKLFADQSKSTIYDVIPFKKGSLDKNIENENFTILPFGNFELLILKSGVKEIQKLNEKYIAAAVTGFAGVQQIKQGIYNEWDSIAYRYRDSLYGGKRKLDDAGFITNVRSKSVCYDSVQNKIYLATSLGIITATPKRVDELLYKQNRIYAVKIAYYAETVFAFLHSGEILTASPHGEVKIDEKLNTYAPYQFFKQQDSLLFLGTAKELFYVNIAKKDLVFKQIPFSILTSELNDIIFHEGHFYLSVNNELIKIRQSTIAGQNQVPFYINYIESNVSRYYKTTGIRFSADEKDIKINYSVLDFFQSGLATLYKINNERWQKCEPGSRTILLASLAPDNYAISFSVNGKLYDKVVQFTIRKPWYLTWWFLSLCIAGLLQISFLYYKFRLSSSKKASSLLIEKANLEKDLRQSMLSSIKSQMNPHFLFNALNTIQSYIITEDKVNASNYLSKFSKLTRKILEMSDRETISLQEEIDALMLYIELEKMRFHELNYTIEIDKNIDTQHSSIPSMIIQPYVENAIKHGLLHKTGEKQLFISITQAATQLQIRIEDNGIGRERSRQMQSSRNSNHSSFASHANMKRVELLNIERNEIGIEYIDKTNKNGEAAGTVIIIKIPIKESK